MPSLLGRSYDSIPSHFIPSHSIPLRIWEIDISNLQVPVQFIPHRLSPSASLSPSRLISRWFVMSMMILCLVKENCQQWLALFLVALHQSSSFSYIQVKSILPKEEVHVWFHSLTILPFLFFFVPSFFALFIPFFSREEKDIFSDSWLWELHCRKSRNAAKGKEKEPWPVLTFFLLHNSLTLQLSIINCSIHYYYWWSVSLLDHCSKWIHIILTYNTVFFLSPIPFFLFHSSSTPTPPFHFHLPPPFPLTEDASGLKVRGRSVVLLHPFFNTSTHPSHTQLSLSQHPRRKPFHCRPAIVINPSPSWRSPKTSLVVQSLVHSLIHSFWFIYYSFPSSIPSLLLALPTTMDNNTFVYDVDVPTIDPRLVYEGSNAETHTVNHPDLSTLYILCLLRNRC